MTKRGAAGWPPRGPSAGRMRNQHGLSADWGSAGAISGPPQMKEGRIRLNGRERPT